LGAEVRYSDIPAFDAVYALVAQLSEPDDPGQARLEEAMIIAAALVELGEDRSWASVWWAYGALHYELSDEALDRALELLARVDRPANARAAALMLRAEIKYTQAAYSRSDPSPIEQRALLDQAVSLAPEWPALRLRLARASKAAGDEPAARNHAAAALTLLASGHATPDPFDSAITGRNLDSTYVSQELEALGLQVGPEQ
jgi:hypothetical protein